MVGFGGILDTGYAEDLQMMKKKFNRWKTIVYRFRSKLVKMIKDVRGKLYDYLISPKIRQILLHCGYELTEKDFFLT